MSQLNDAIVAIVGPQINDGLLNHYQTNGATSGQLNDAEYEFLLANGATPGHIQDMWVELLQAAGYTGSLNDMLLPFWLAGGVFGPISPPVFSGTIPNGDTCEEELFTYDAKPNYSTGGPITSWSLINAPVGMTINAQGVVRWTPAIGDSTASGIQVSGNNVTGPAALSNPFSVTVNALPTVVSSNVDAAGTTLTLTMSADTTGTNGFTLFANGVPVALSAPVDGASTITFTTDQVYAGQVLTLDYTLGDVVDAATSCALKAFTGASVTNNSTVPLPVAPVYQSSNVDTAGTTLTVVYDSNIAGGTGFTYRVDGGAPIALTGGVVAGNEISFTVAQIFDTDIVTLSYTPGDVVGDPNGLPAEAFANQAVTNNSTVPSLQAPIFSGTIANQTGNVGTPFSLDVSGNFSTGGAVATYSLTNNPSWMSIDNAGLITGTPDAEAITTNITVTGTNAAGSDTSNAWQFDAQPAAGITPIFERDFTTGSLGAGATFSRASNATYIDDTQPAGSQIQVALDNEARFETLNGETYLLLEPVSTNYFLNSFSPATQTINGRSGNHTFSVHGSGSMTLTGGGASGQVVTQGNPVTINLTGSVTCTISGSLEAAQCEPGVFATSFIQTVGTEVSRAADSEVVYSLTTPQAAGTVAVQTILMWKPTAANDSLIRFLNGGGFANDPLWLTNGNVNWVKTTDGSTEAIVGTDGGTPNREYVFAFKWGSNLQNGVWNGAGLGAWQWSQLQPYDGGFNTNNVLQIADDRYQGRKIKHVAVYDQELTTQQIEGIWPK